MAKAPKKAPTKTPSKSRAKAARPATKKAPAAKTAQPTEVAQRGGLDDVFAGLAGLRHDMDRMFEEMSSDFGLFPHRWRFPTLRMPKFESISWPKEPKVDVAETDRAITVTAELPGIEEKDVDVTVGDGYISISGEKRTEKEEKKKGSYMQERSYGSFHRSFRLPDSVDADKISADLAKGVLTVTLPKRAQAAASKRKLSVSAK